MIGTNYDKELRKKLIKSIKIKHNKKWFNYIDKIFKIQKIKIKNMHLEDSNKTNKYYKVEYSYGFNKINPVSWIFIILLFMSKVIETIVECIGEFRDTERQTYTGTFKIK